MNRDRKFLHQQVAWITIGTACALILLLAIYLFVPLERVGAVAAAGIGFVPAVVALGVYTVLGWRGTRS